jgi:hypothetical protein
MKEEIAHKEITSYNNIIQFKKKQEHFSTNQKASEKIK